nr:hypothetical protein [Tanacetum cinerariifolium]
MTTLLPIVDHTEETRSGSTTAHANNSLPEYDAFCFEIDSDQERLTSVIMKDISDDSSNDPLSKEVDLFLASDNSIPLSIENIDYDSEGDIHFLEELLVGDSILLPENESSNFDHQDDPSFPRPPPEPQDDESFFDLEPNLGEVISVVMNNIDELDEDACFDLGNEPDQERLINLMKNDNSDNSSNDPLLEEVDLFLSDDSIPLEPPDDNFDLELEVISAVMEDIDEPDEHFNPGGEIFVSINKKDVDYFPFMFVIQIFLPYLILPEISPLLLFPESEDMIFDPGLSPDD